MKKNGLLQISSLVLLSFGIFQSPSMAQTISQVNTTQVQVAPESVRNLSQLKLSPLYLERELKAPVTIKNQLSELRQNIQSRKFTFHVGYTTALDYKLEQLAATKAPDDLPTQASTQNTVAAQILKIDLAERDKFAKANPGVVIPELRPIGSRGCFASAKSFDWRNLNKVTPVRDQGGCGSCWDFATIGAYEEVTSFGITLPLMLPNSIFSTGVEQVVVLVAGGLMPLIS